MSPLHWRRICISEYFEEEAEPARAAAKVAAGARGRDRAEVGAAGTSLAPAQSVIAFVPIVATKSRM